MKCLRSKILVILYIFSSVHAEQLEIEYNFPNFETYLNGKYYRDGCASVNGYMINVKSVHDLRKVSEENPKRHLEHESTTFVKNCNEFKQDGLTSAYKRTFTESKMVTISITQELTGTVKIPQIPYLDAMTIKFGHTRTTSDTTTTAVERSAPSQKVSIDPRSKVQVTYALYSKTVVHHYLIDFEIDNDSDIIFDASKRSFWNSFTCGIHRIYPFRNLLEELNLFNSKLSSGNIEIKRESGKWILKNLPFKLETVDAEMSVLFGPQQKLNDREMRECQ